MEPAQQTAELSQHRGVVAASVSVGGASALDDLGMITALVSKIDTGSSAASRSAGNPCTARKLRISASPCTRSSRSAAEEKTRAIQGGPSGRRTYSVDG